MAGRLLYRDLFGVYTPAMPPQDVVCTNRLDAAMATIRSTEWARVTITGITGACLDTGYVKLTVNGKVVATWDLALFWTTPGILPIGLPLAPGEAAGLTVAFQTGEEDMRFVLQYREEI